MKNYAEIFTKFLQQLSDWSTTGKEPDLANQDMKYYLDLQEARLKSHNVQLKINYEPEYKVTSSYQVAKHLPIVRHFMKFNYNTYYQGVNREYAYYIDGKCKKKFKDYVTVYQTIVDGDENLADTAYVCPNCGAIANLQTLQEEGCPYCNTHYIMEDLYPKVINYYSINTGALSSKSFDQTRKTIGTLAAIVSALITLNQIHLTADYYLYFRILSAVFTALLSFPFVFILIYFAYNISLLIGLIHTAAKSIPVSAGSKGTKNKIDRYLKKYDPSFDYEYFEGKALSLARIVLLNDDIEQATQYEGTRLDDSFKNIIDVQYLGGLGLQEYYVEGSLIVLKLRLYVETTQYKNKKIKKDRKPIVLEMIHNTKFPVDAGFSIMKVQCSSCGASFDARKIKHCPYCHSKYNIIDHDWFVRRVSR